MEIQDFEVAVNGTTGYSLKGELLEVFSCGDLNEFEAKFLKSLNMEINKACEVPANHILKIEPDGVDQETSYILSAMAMRSLAYIAANMQINQDETFKIYCDIDKQWSHGFFAPQEDRPLEVGEMVEILTVNPDKTYPATALINYRGKVGRIVDSEPEGYLHVVISANVPAAAFRPSSLKRVSK